MQISLSVSKRSEALAGIPARFCTFSKRLLPRRSHRASSSDKAVLKLDGIGFVLNKIDGSPHSGQLEPIHKMAI